jgi:ATP-dependent Clp protease ATP-binding subunit ClpA
MLERFTKRAREVVERAVEIATESRASQVRPEHLFAAVLWDSDCLVVRVLEQCGADLDRLHAELDRRRSRYVDGLDDDDATALSALGIDLAEVVRRLGDAPRGGPRFGRPRKRFSRSAKKVLELSLREAIALRHNYIGTEHLLLGLVRDGDAIVNESLRDAGVDMSALRQSVADAVRRAG